jgi:hypothetical protein
LRRVLIIAGWPQQGALTVYCKREVERDGGGGGDSHLIAKAHKIYFIIT